MTTLTFLLELHALQNCGLYLGRPENINDFQQAVFANEECKFFLGDKIGPLSSPIIDQLLANFQRIQLLLARGENPHISPSRLSSIPLFKGHPRIYCIDSIYGSNEVKDIIDAQIAKLDVETDYLNRVNWARDRYMAFVLIQLLLQYSSIKDIIVKVGVTHSNIIYHLLYLLPPNLRHTKITALDLTNGYMNLAHAEGTKYFFYEDLPVPLIRGDWTTAPSIAALNAREINTIPSDRLVIFNKQYEALASQYENLCALFEKICKDTAEFTKNKSSHLKTKIDQDIARLLSMPLPANSGQLIGKELCASSLLPTPRGSTPLPTQFMIRHFKPI